MAEVKFISAPMARHATGTRMEAQSIIDLQTRHSLEVKAVYPLTRAESSSVTSPVQQRP